MRMEIRALAINRRSIVTMKRLNKPAEGARPRETVLDISVPFRAVQRIAALGSGDKLRIPDASNNPFVCIAAFSLLQCNINGTIELPNSKRPPETGGLSRS